MILVPRPSGGSPEVVQPAKYTGGEIRMARLEPELSKPGDLGIFFSWDHQLKARCWVYFPMENP